MRGETRSTPVSTSSPAPAANYCAFAVSRGTTADADPHQWAVVDGKLYVNNNAFAKKLWDQDRPGNIVAGDANWPLIPKRPPARKLRRPQRRSERAKSRKARIISRRTLVGSLTTVNRGIAVMSELDGLKLLRRIEEGVAGKTGEAFFRQIVCD